MYKENCVIGCTAMNRKVELCIKNSRNTIAVVPVVFDEYNVGRISKTTGTKLLDKKCYQDSENGIISQRTFCR